MAPFHHPEIMMPRMQGGQARQFDNLIKDRSQNECIIKVQLVCSIL